MHVRVTAGGNVMPNVLSLTNEKAVAGILANLSNEIETIEQDKADYRRRQIEQAVEARQQAERQVRAAKRAHARHAKLIQAGLAGLMELGASDPLQKLLGLQTRISRVPAFMRIYEAYNFRGGDLVFVELDARGLYASFGCSESKAYEMTGLRIKYGDGLDEVLPELLELSYRPRLEVYSLHDVACEEHDRTWSPEEVLFGVLRDCATPEMLQRYLARALHSFKTQ
jgi:hypothetical protein